MEGACQFIDSHVMWKCPRMAQILPYDWPAGWSTSPTTHHRSASQNHYNLGKRCSSWNCKMTDSNPLTKAVETQLSITSSFHLWLTRQLEKNPSHGELISKIESRLDSYTQTLSKINPTHIGTDPPDDPESWTLTIGPQKSTGDDKTTRIPVTGPGADDYSEIIAKDEQEARYITGVCWQLPSLKGNGVEADSTLAGPIPRLHQENCKNIYPIACSFLRTDLPPNLSHRNSFKR